MATPRVTIDELPEHLAPVDANLIIVQDAGISKKMSIATLKTLESDALTDHLSDAAGAHAASAISATASSVDVDGPNVQAQLSQLASLVTSGGVDEEAGPVDAVAAALVAGDSIDIAYDDVGNTITVSTTMQWVAMTQAEYDALVTPDPDTLYVIIP